MSDADTGWNVSTALQGLQARMDPYIWDQGQELFRRDAVEDVAVLGDGTVQVKVLDPRDARHFFVAIRKDKGGRVDAVCPCPYRFEGVCRHQVVALEYLRAVSEGGLQPVESGTEAPADLETGAGESAAAGAGATADSGPFSVLYREVEASDKIKTTSDGSLLRLVLRSLGSSQTPHKVGLQLYTGTGWTEVRTGDVERWIGRGVRGSHPRDAYLAAQLAAGGVLSQEIDSEAFASLLHAMQGSDAVVDRSGRPLAVSPWPRTLTARVVRAPRASEQEPAGLGVEFRCQASDESSCLFTDVVLVPAVVPWIQLEDASFCLLVAGAPGPLLEELQLTDFETIPADELDRFLTAGMEQLERICCGAVESEPDLIREVEGIDSARVQLSGTPARLSGVLELSYGGHWEVAPESPEPWTVSEGGTIHRYPPAGQSLARARRELEALGFQRDEGDWVLEGSGVLCRVLEPRPEGFVQLLLPSELEAFDLVDRPPVLRLRVHGVDAGSGAGGGGAAADSSGRRAGSGGGSGIAWLDVGFGLYDGSRELPLALDDLRDAAAAHRESPDGAGLVELGDGSVIRLEHAAVRSLVDLADEAERRGAPVSEGETALRLPLFLVGDLTHEEEGREVTFDPETRAGVEAFVAGAEVELPVLRADVEELLRPYQKPAVEWFGRLARYGLGGVLADEMGLGKTIMTLAHFFGHEVAASERSLPVLVVCPTSLGFNWLAECHRFFPEVRAVGLTGQSPAERRARVEEGADLLVTSYALMRRDRELFEAQEFQAIVLDEAQHIKNPKSQTAKAAFALNARERWGLTGTPIENHLGELWSIFHFCLPGFLGTAEEFQEQFSDPISRGEDGVFQRLRHRLRPFLLRRTKVQVLPDLPPRIEQVERVPMTDAQRDVYPAYSQRARGELGSADPKRSRFQILAALTRLRQICCHPRLVLTPEELSEVKAKPEDLAGGKFGLLEELLDECLDEGHRVLLFSQFTGVLDLIEERLDERGIRKERLDGSTRDREGVVRSFREDASIPIFLISLKAGGFGLNLTEADTVILYDPWWNPATEEQAAARAHRLGQTVPVHVHRLITAGTIEEKIVELQAVKKDLADRVIESEEEVMQVLGTDELKELLFS